MKVPPLRERVCNIALLAKHFIESTGLQKELSAKALSALRLHTWPGNVRELEQCVTRACLLSSRNSIEVADLELEMQGSETSKLPNVGSLPNELLDNSLSLKDAQRVFTRSFVHQVLDRSQGKRTRASANLGISERSLYQILADTEV